MAYFLRDYRRIRLVRDLVQQLAVPEHVAQTVAGYTDDLRQLDQTLAALVNTADEHFIKAFDAMGDKRWQFEAYFKADLMILKAYFAEAGERRLLTLSFPKLDGAVAQSMHRIEEFKARRLQ